jgi:hypothetical protein
MQAASTLGELRQQGYTVRPVREEIRRNLLTKLGRGERILPGIVGFDDTVVPEIENAILAGHHMVFLGERGQAKSRIIRALTGLLDSCVPIVQGCPINDNPFHPICQECRRRLADLGDALPVAWIGPDARYGEKLATPDVSIADLIGEIDPVKVAEGRYLADEETIHYGLVPRTNRGIFAINELPDLTEKVQVGLFNLMEEKDVQIKGYKIRLPLDIVIVASANPEDSGVSVRISINNYESVLSNAEKRAVRLDEREIVPRISDLHSVLASTSGKIELEYAGEDKKADELIDRLLNRAILKVFDKYLKLEDLKSVVDYFENGWGMEVSDGMPSTEYLDALRAIPGLQQAVRTLGGVESPGFIAAATEFVLEGLHLHQKLNKDRQGARYSYRA